MKITLNQNTLGMILKGISDKPTDGTWQVEVSKVKSQRSDAQRRLQFLWYTEIGKQTYETKQEVERYCKLTFGVPILIRDNEDFANLWPQQSELLGYEDKLLAMGFLPLTRLFNVSQNTEYLNDMQRDYLSNGIVLPEPEDLYFESMGYKRK